jgi:hypothetical protein
VVDADLAELVDDHRRVAEGRPAQQVVEQGRLAAAEEAGQHQDGMAGLVAHGRG